MNQWLLAALILVVALGVCTAAALAFDLVTAVIALEVGGVVAVTTLLVLAEAMHRQSFVDLALVTAVLALPGALIFVRLLERRI
jgi:multisubunit Na+/H+ antiporter MnhF subunit